MKCQHHPKYDPSKEEPPHESFMDIEGFVVSCPYCWRARAKWLEQEKRRLVTDCEAYRHAHEDFIASFDTKDERIAELVGQLADAQKGWAEELSKAVDADVKAEKREAVLWEILWELEQHGHPCECIHCEEWWNKYRKALEKEKLPHVP